jgi:hypothetical protein
LPTRRFHRHIREVLFRGYAGEPNVATQAATLDDAFHFLRRVSVGVREHDALERHGDNQHAEDVLATGLAQLGEIDLAGREAHFAGLLAVEIDDRVRIQTLDPQRDAPAGPSFGDGHLTLIPRRGEVAHVRVLPRRMGEERLAVFLDVVAVARPEARHLEVAPGIGGHGVRAIGARLPAPQAVEADALAGWRSLSMGLVEIPDGVDAGRKNRVGGRRGGARREEDQECGGRPTRETVAMRLHGLSLLQLVAERSRHDPYLAVRCVVSVLQRFSSYNFHFSMRTDSTAT